MEELDCRETARLPTACLRRGQGVTGSTDSQEPINDAFEVCMKTQTMEQGSLLTAEHTEYRAESHTNAPQALLTPPRLTKIKLTHSHNTLIHPTEKKPKKPPKNQTEYSYRVTEKKNRLSDTFKSRPAEDKSHRDLSEQWKPREDSSQGTI